MRTCSSCKETKGDDKFRPGKKSAKCKDCLAIQSAAYYEANKHKWAERDQRMREKDAEAFRKKSREAQARYRASPTNTIHLRYLKKRYGITVEQYAEMFDKQKGGCAICGKEPDRIRLHVDHDHATGKVRGLLCFDCNLVLGHARDNTAILDAAKAYLLSHA